MIRKSMITTAGMLCILAASCTKVPQDSHGDDGDRVSKFVGDITGERQQGVLLIKLTDQAQADVEDGKMLLTDLTEGIDGATITPAMATRPKNMQAARRHGLHRWYAINFSQETSPEYIAAKVQDDKRIQFIQYNTYKEHIGTSVSVEYMAESITRSTAGVHEGLPFNDPNLPDQWNLINTGDKRIAETAVAGADVGVKDAWRLTAGDPRIIVAVFDEGIRVRHEDLKEALWVNEREMNGKDNFDDDKNGYKDDKHGYNFTDRKGEPSAKAGYDHGTHVAGIIAATNNNGKGVSSVAGGTGHGDGVRLMSCQIFNESGKTDGRTVAEAFHYAADHGACIAQCSYGQPGGSIMSDEAYLKNPDNTYEYDALQYFLNPANSNCPALETNIAIFSAGNESAEASSYPGALPFCISVTAIGPDFLPGCYSNHGPGCNIAAPGGDPWLTATTYNSPAMILSTGVTGNSNSSYVYKYGTSMACPHVSGVVALGMSYALKTGKTFTSKEFISRLLTSTNDIDCFMTEGKIKHYQVETGPDQFMDVDLDISTYRGKMGVGAVDAWKFLMALEGTPTILTSPGKETSVNLADYAGRPMTNLDYRITMDPASMESLGLTTVPQATAEGMLKISCPKIGSGKLRIEACSGKDADREDGIGGFDISREISIVSRASTASNGGWF